MAIATMTTKGQITIPKEVRDALGLKPGDRVRFELVENGEAVLRPLTGRLEDLIGILKYHGQPVTIEEMDAGIARHLAEKHRRRGS